MEKSSPLREVLKSSEESMPQAKKLRVDLRNLRLSAHYYAGLGVQADSNHTGLASLVIIATGRAILRF